MDLGKYQFDAIMLSCVLEFAPEERHFEIVQKLSSKLRKGGFIHLFMPHTIFDRSLKPKMRQDATLGFAMFAHFHPKSYYSGYSFQKLRRQ